MHRFHWAMIAAAMAVPIALGFGPVGIGPRPAEAGPSIRPDAAVELVKPDGAVVARLVVEIAESPTARGRGLMERALTDYLAGMLFIFESAEPQTFWMRNTPSSLDMLFVDAAGRVLNIAAYTTPMSDRLYSSTGPAKYVLETKAGFADRFGIRPGDTLRWKRLR